MMNKARLDRDQSQGPSCTSRAFITDKALDRRDVSWSCHVYTRASFDRNAPSTKRAIAEIHDKEVYDKLRR
jgi:hypothetical protein